MRLAAFLFVFVHHAFPQNADAYASMRWPSAAAGWIASSVLAFSVGVDLFFLLSSFLITELLLREIASRGSFDIRSFYIRRALRIWPLYFAFLAVSFWIVPRILPQDHISSVHALAFVSFVGNWTTAFLGYPTSVIAPLWSISLEEQFYIAWPLLIALSGARRIIPLAIGLFVLAIAYRAVLVAFDVPHPASWTSTFSQLDPVAFGAIIAVVLRGRSPQLGPYTRAMLLIGAIAIWIPSVAFLGKAGPASQLCYPLIALACAAMLIGTLCREPTWRFARTGVLVYLGRISYGLYVYHVLSIHLTQQYASAWGSMGMRAALALSLTIALAVTSYHLLELPFLRLKQRFAHIPSQHHGLAPARLEGARARRGRRV